MDARVLDLIEESTSIAALLEDTEWLLGPALHACTFAGPPPAGPDQRVWALLGLEDPVVAADVSEAIFPHGVPVDVDAARVLRALREAAWAAAQAARDGSSERRVAMLWAITAERHAIAAHRIHGLAGVLLHAMASRWASLATSLEAPVAAA